VDRFFRGIVADDVDMAMEALESNTFNVNEVTLYYDIYGKASTTF
jgi:hypothetical protein